MGNKITYINSAGTGSGVAGADLTDSAGNMHCFMLPLSSLFTKISVLTQCRILVAVHCVQDGNS